tara:strand:- start:12304 stop:12468 length:165 start_codon:yes stop_codon:yes gene_type:complete
MLCIKIDPDIGWQTASRIQYNYLSMKMFNSQNGLVEQGFPRFISRYFNVLIVGY